MVGAAAFFVWLMVWGGVFIGATLILSYQLTPQPERRRRLGELIAWCCKGVLLPTALWALMNLGLSFRLQPFMPEIQAAWNHGAPWFPPFSRYLGYGVFVIASYWMAVTLAWGLVRCGRRLDEEARPEFKHLCWTYGLGMLLPAVVVELFGGWAGLGVAASVILAPLAASLPGVLVVKRMPPMYARAVARMKFGKYAEAEAEILQELEKCENDFEGWMMLADLYANQFHDLSEAEQTVLDICDQPGTTPSQLSIALHRLADWQLKLAGNPNGARKALRLIGDRLPGTHLARMAQLRLNQLPANSEELRQQQQCKTIPLPALRDPLETEAPMEPTPQEIRQAAARAQACVSRLKQDPDNVAVREQLARLLAERLNQPDQGIEQLQLLLGLPDQPQSKQADWAALVAAWHLHRRRDTQSAQRWLERILRDYPSSPHIFAAQRWLKMLEQSAAATPPSAELPPTGEERA